MAVDGLAGWAAAMWRLAVGRVLARCGTRPGPGHVMAHYTSAFASLLAAAGGHARLLAERTPSASTAAPSSCANRCPSPAPRRTPLRGHLNDLLLTAIAGGVHDLLSARGEATEGRLCRCSCPSVRITTATTGSATRSRRWWCACRSVRPRPPSACARWPGAERSAKDHDQALATHLLLSSLDALATGGGLGGQPPRAPPTLRQPGRDERPGARRPALRPRCPHARGHPPRPARGQPQRGRGRPLLRRPADHRHPGRPRSPAPTSTCCTEGVGRCFGELVDLVPRPRAPCERARGVAG